MHLSSRALMALSLIGTVSSLTASSTAIGLAVANGSFQVNTSPAHGSATLFDGTVIETSKVPSQLRLQNGMQLRLAVDSRAKVYPGRVVLEKGSGQIQSSSSPYPVESHNIRVFSTVPNTIARVQLADQGRVLVAALEGSVRVTNSAGVVLANLPSGLSMAFAPQAGASGPAHISGCLYESDGKEFIYDSMTQAPHGLKGLAMAKEIGKNVEITGIEDPDSHLIAVSTWKQLAAGKCAKFAEVAKDSGVQVAAATVGTAGAAAAGAAGVAGAAGAAGAGAAAGVGAAATVAVVGGVAAAATVGGVAMAGGFSGTQQTPTTSP